MLGLPTGNKSGCCASACHVLVDSGHDGMRDSIHFAQQSRDGTSQKLHTRVGSGTALCPRYFAVHWYGNIRMDSIASFLLTLL